MDGDGLQPLGLPQADALVSARERKDFVMFTPEEIKNKEFVTILRGYDKEEVRAFLQAVAADYEAMQEPSGGEEPDREVIYSALGHEIAGILKVARATADQMKARTQEEASRLLEEANEDAEQLRATAEREATGRLEDAARKVEHMRATEMELNRRKEAIERLVAALRHELDIVEASQLTEERDDHSAVPVALAPNEQTPAAPAHEESRLEDAREG